MRFYTRRCIGPSERLFLLLMNYSSRSLHEVNRKPLGTHATAYSFEASTWWQLRPSKVRWIRTTSWFPYADQQHSHSFDSYFLFITPMPPRPSLIYSPFTLLSSPSFNRYFPRCVGAIQKSHFFPNAGGVPGFMQRGQSRTRAKLVSS